MELIKEVIMLLERGDYEESHCAIYLYLFLYYHDTDANIVRTIYYSYYILFLDIQFGGGRVIRPGEVLETADDKADKEARTRQLLAAYKTKIGLNIDPKLKSECDQV